MEATIEKIDLTKVDQAYYKAQRKPQLVDLDSYYYLTHQGKGSPSSSEFEQALQRLYAVAYQVKFLCKSQDMDFVVPKMEGIWWIDGGLEEQHEFTQKPESEWNWKIIIRMPDFVEADHYYRAVQLVKNKNEELLDDQVKFELIKEGRCVQVLHLGSYHEEEPTILEMLKLINDNDLKVVSYHREIYLSDPRRTPEEKLRTILRYSVE